MTESANHPILSQMLTLGCSQAAVAVAFQVYEDLVDGRCFWDVGVQHNKKLNVIFMTARKTKSGVVEAFVPMSAKSKLSVDDICALQTELLFSSVNVVVKSSDSTAVYHRLAQGLVRPESPGATAQRKQRDQRRRQTAIALACNKTDILEKAAQQKSLE